MSRILVVPNNNYKVQVATGGTITLDTQANGAGYGTVVVKGNLDVIGTTSYIESTNTQVKDNLLQLNYGQTGNGITGNTAGIEIERGNYSAAQFLFNEAITHYDEISSLTLSTVKITGTAGQFSCATSTLVIGATVTITGTINAGSITGYTSPTTYYIIATDGSTTFTLSTTYNGTAITTTSSGATNLTATVVVNNTGTNVSGTFQLKTADGKLGGLAVETITNAAGTTDIVFDLQSTSKVLTVANSSSYDQYVIRDGDIPNLKYLKSYVASSYVIGGAQGMAIVDSIRYPISSATVAAANSAIQAGSTTIDLKISNTTIASVASTGVSFGNVRVGGTGTPNTITNTSGNNLILIASTGRLQLDSTLTSTISPGTGKTGLFFVNNNSYSDELVAKNRALLFSILF